jgi:hypothetical protein
VAAAVDALGTTDIATIIRNYRGSRFKFASRNFYPEFLAALQVERDFEQHFGPLHTEAPLQHDEVSIDCPIPLRTAARFAGTDEEEIIFLNPALGESVREKRASIPHRYDLRIPSGARVTFLKAYEPWQVEEKGRLAALEEARKARLMALRAKGLTKHKRLVASRAHGKTKGKEVAVSKKSGKRSATRQVAREGDAKPRKPRG